MKNSVCPGWNDPIRVLLVDESKTFLHAATDLLRRQRETVVTGVVHEKDALRQLQALQPHVVLVGLDAPDLAGLKLVSRLRVTMPGVAIVALTLLNGKAYRQAALSAGADEVVAKTTLSTDLVPVIRRLAQGWRELEQDEFECK